MMNSLVLGAQWGDEGKGRVVDLLASEADFTVRFGGGENAGHTLVVNGQKTVLHLIPAGALNPNCRGLIGNGCVVSPESLWREVIGLKESGVDLTPSRLGISGGAHVVTPYHKIVDLATGTALGTTGRGIGPCYADKIARRGLRFEQLFTDDALAVLDAQRIFAQNLCSTMLPSAQLVLDELRSYGQHLQAYGCDVGDVLFNAMQDRKRILFEGAQGTMLDIDHGTYPFVTSSTTTAGGVAPGVGVWVDFDRKIGVTKAYTTRVGTGPFPTEIDGDIGDRIRSVGAEYGSTTGRPRRVGWLDLVALRKAVRLNGLTDLIVTKLDVLSDMPFLMACSKYDNGQYTAMAGFGSIAHIRDWDDLPHNAREYIRFIEDETGVPVTAVSVGAEREALITVPPRA